MLIEPSPDTNCDSNLDYARVTYAGRLAEIAPAYVDDPDDGRYPLARVWFRSRLPPKLAGFVQLDMRPDGLDVGEL